MLKEQIRIFFTAVMFYSRIPCPKWVDHSEEYLNKATRYFPLVGWIVASFSSLVFAAFWYLDEPIIGVLLSMVASIWITGAFHEDGFADVCDGFGGGWTKEKILTIMKDSQVGAYGAIGIGLMLTFKLVLLVRIANLFEENLIFILAAIFSGHSLSRFVAATFIYTHEYSRDDATSKVKPVSKQISLSELAIAALFGIAPLLLFQNAWVFTLVLPLVLVKWRLGKYFQKWINGYTGDCLGATQQLIEVIFYLSLSLLWKFF